MKKRTRELIKQYILEHQIKYSSVTLRKYTSDFREFFSFFKGEYDCVTAKDIRNWILRLESIGLSASTRNEKLSALKSLYRYCVEEVLVESNPAAVLCLAKLPKLRPYYLDKEQLSQLRDVSKDEARDRAFVETLYATGVRVSELTNIKLIDIDWDLRTIVIRKGKDKKDRVVLFTPLCAQCLKEYLSLLKSESPFLFPGYKAGLTPTEIRRSFRSFSKKLGNRVTPHVMRHTFAAHLAEKGMPLECIQDLLGHDKIKNTKIYSCLYAKARKKKYEYFM